MGDQSCSEDFDDRHDNNCISFQSTLSVRVNMSEPNNGHALSKKHDARPRYTGERLLRERPKIYRQVLRLLGELNWRSHPRVMTNNER
jgi:hypothetical protein